MTDEEDQQRAVEPILLEKPRQSDFGPLRRWLGRALLKVAGWKVESVVPDVPKGIIVAAPHTSSWDLTIMLAVSYALGVRLKWMGRSTMFTGIRGALFRRLGGIPVDRNARRNAVQQMVDAFDATDRLLVVVAPEGRLERADHWKSGFYHIARGAKVPIGLGFLNYANKTGGVGTMFYPTGDVGRDMDFIRRFYCAVDAKFPEKYGPIRLRDE
jgi:1-acyl-sn-glycerol-3-phosphate acyltransferase